MKNPVVRGIVAIVVGALVTGLIVLAVELLGHGIYPPPPGLDIAKPEDQARIVAAMPTGAKVAVVVAWFLGALGGAVAAARIGRSPRYAWVIGFLTVAMCIFSLVSIPHPVWMAISGVALPVIAAAIAIPLSRPRVSA